MNKKIFSITVLALFLFGTVAMLSADEQCGIVEFSHKLIEDHPELEQAIESSKIQLDEEARAFSERTSGLAVSHAPIVIPVVVHVIYADFNGPENILDAKVIEGIEQVNEDFKMLNADSAVIHPDCHGLISNTQMIFRLAKLDPNGNPTNGITRIHNPSWSANGASDESNMKLTIGWPQHKYMNIYVVTSAYGGNSSAYAYYPSSVQPPWEHYDGITISAWAYDRTTAGYYTILSHAIGHWVNLIHTWGDNVDAGLPSSYNIDDKVADIPNCLGDWGTQYNQNTTSCDSLDNNENYMDSGQCQTMFTAEQVVRMYVAMNSSIGRRNEIWLESNLIDTGVYETNFTPTGKINGEYYGTNGVTVNFTSKGSYDVDGSITSYLWDFGDGATSTAADPTHTYNANGEYQVSLTVIDNGGKSSTTSTNAYITPPGTYISAETESNDDSANANNPIGFDTGISRSLSSGSDQDCEASVSEAASLDKAYLQDSCSDACNLGDTLGNRVCELYDSTTGKWIAPDPKGTMHDRARAYNMWLRRHGLYFGGVVNAHFSDPPTYNNRIGVSGSGDSALWTGSYLAAEALRLMATGSPDARENVKKLVNTLHLWFNVAGDPGLLARFTAPAGQHPLVKMDCDNRRYHCNVSHGGQVYDYIGDVSRDQYQGVMLGYALAYEALGKQDKSTRALIRKDVVEFVEELMRERQLRVHITVNGYKFAAVKIKTRFVVLATREMDKKHPELVIDLNNVEDSQVWGFQEFIPNLGDVVRQIPVFSWLKKIPRPSSAIMLASFFRVGLLVTHGVPGYEQKYKTIRDYYRHNSSGKGGNVNHWLKVADDWSYYDNCGKSYFANNIAMQPLYNWARLEDDLGILQRIQRDVIETRLWPTFVHTKNPFFSYIYAANAFAADPSVVQIANEQLGQFTPPPRVRVKVDLRSDPRYMPHEPGCSDQCNHRTAVDVGERVIEDFLWQRHPWRLRIGANPRRVYPGVDYLLAYWLGRHHGYLANDTPGKCLAWH